MDMTADRRMKRIFSADGKSPDPLREDYKNRLNTWGLSIRGGHFGSASVC
ncbi:Uncharacterized protein dnm_100630 [Desulfonema magnum]|uniref:Uncharacterized protein n=1 Tax=Desulfonema magnum TaxID=45655 RepID=A0A975BYF7_9BACT|nr:Uncharacterized protein dnm_100630 [Desulfonema magnum]